MLFPIVPHDIAPLLLMTVPKGKTERKPELRVPSTGTPGMVSNYFVKCFLAQGQKESIFSPMLIHFVYRGEFFGVSDRDTLSVQYNKADFFQISLSNPKNSSQN